MQEFTLREIAERAGVSKSTVKAYTLRHGIKPVDTSGNTYLYPEDLMEIIAEKYAEPANSAKLFKQAEDSIEITNLKKQVAQLIDYAGWWSELDDQRLVPVYVYRYMLTNKAVQTDEKAIKLLKYFGSFSLDPTNEKLKQAVKHGEFEYFVWMIYRCMKRPADMYVMINRWNKYSDDNKHLLVKYVDSNMSKKYKSYHDFKTGSSSGSQGSGAPALEKEKLISATGSDEPKAKRCKSALLAGKKDKEMEM